MLRRTLSTKGCGSPGGAAYLGEHHGFRACQPDAKGDRRLSVNLFRHKAKLEFSQDETGLKTKLPSEKPCDYACSFKIAGLKLR
jgi:hypothetical protein